SKRGTIALHELADEVFIAAEVGIPRRTWEDNWLAAHGVRRTVRLSAGHMEVSKQAVIAGFGVALLSRRGLGKELADGSLVQVCIMDEPWPPIERGIIYRKGMHLTPLHEAFLTHCRAFAAEQRRAPQPAA